MFSLNPEFIIPDWPAKPNIKAISSTRLGGVSRAPYNGFNLAEHVDDNTDDVTENRRKLKEYGRLPAEPCWLQQTHSTIVVSANPEQQSIDADGSVCNQAGVVCVVQTADCLPILLTTNNGNKVGALHAGWRGLCNGIIEKGIAAMMTQPDQIIVWMGPAIGPNYFEVGEDVFNAYDNTYPGSSQVFKATGDRKWHMNIYEAARQVLHKSGVNQIYGGDHCTYTDEKHFYSYRRDGICGRMASMIWMEN